MLASFQKAVDMRRAAGGSPETWVAGDGTILRMRPVSSIDAAGLMAFVQGLSLGARYFRYGRPDSS